MALTMKDGLKIWLDKMDVNDPKVKTEAFRDSMIRLAEDLDSEAPMDVKLRRVELEVFGRTGVITNEDT